MDQASVNRLVVDDFTEEAMVSRKCERHSCAKTLPPGTPRYPVENRHGQQRWFCLQCFQDIQQKPTTLNTKTCSSTIARPSAEQNVDYQAIRGQNNLAQRYAPGASRVQAIGALNQIPVALPMAASSPHRSVPNVMPLPNVGIPRGGHIIHSSSIHAHQSGALLPYEQGPGYTPAHADYNARKAALAALAYKPASSRSKKGDQKQRTYVQVHAALHYEIRGKIKTQLVHNIHKGLPEVPAHIGTMGLKQYIYDALMPSFKEHFGYNIPISELRLIRSPAHEVLDDNPKLQDAILPFFENAKANSNIAKSGLTLHLVMTPEMWLEACEALEKSESPTRDPSESPAWTRQLTLPPQTFQLSQKSMQLKTLMSKTNEEPDNPVHFNTIRPSTPAGSSRKRSHTVTSPTSPVSQQPKKKLAATMAWRSPDRLAIGQAFARTAHTVSAVTALESSLSVELIPIPYIQFNDLINNRNNNLFQENYGQGRLIVDSKNDVGSGSFKTCNLARLFITKQPEQENILWSSTETLVAKRFYKRLEVQDGGLTQVQILRTPGINDLQFTVREALSLLWANSLMEMAYSFIDSIRSTKDICIDIPKVQFVTAVIARTRNQLGQLEKTMIVEQYINSVKEGPFRKFILNDRAVPIVAEGGPDYNLAEFLCFVQHIQWEKTGGLAFVSDFQGGSTLLTDPQIMTHPLLEVQFGAGNVPDCFIRFPDDHACNRYCATFDLSKPSPYSPTDI